MNNEILWSDLYKVRDMIKELNLGDDLAEKFSKLADPFRKELKKEQEDEH